MNKLLLILLLSISAGVSEAATIAHCIGTLRGTNFSENVKISATDTQIIAEGQYKDSFKVAIEINSNSEIISTAEILKATSGSFPVKKTIEINNINGRGKVKYYNAFQSLLKPTVDIELNYCREI